MSIDDGAERRQHRRHILRVSVNVHFPNGEMHKLRTLDISDGGMSISAPFNPPGGIQFKLQLLLPQITPPGIPFEVTAVVTHSIFSNIDNGFKIGLRFIAPGQSALHALAGYFASHL